MLYIPRSGDRISLDHRDANAVKQVAIEVSKLTGIKHNKLINMVWFPVANEHAKNGKGKFLSL